MRVAFATSLGIDRGRDDDHEAAALLGADMQVWNDPSVDWATYDRVVIRSVWDYTSQLDAFLRWCEDVGPRRLRNRPDLVAFNADKRYLRALAAPTVPTLFVGPGDPAPALHGEVVVKPNVSAGARDTGRFTPADHDDAQVLVAHIQASGRTALIQPYLPLIDERGETAIVYLGGARSHVLRKRAVLREAGIAPLAPGAGAPAAAMLETDLVTAAQATVAELALAAEVHREISERFGTPLYARIDLVPEPDGEPVLLELEVIEPCLYLEQAPGAAQRLADAVLGS
jgi:glutathione synthase/RimK-type ligase-like ATP-grasp enzyme